MRTHLTKFLYVSFIYTVLCAVSFLYHISRHSTDKFSAIFIGILTMPWSLLTALVKDLIIYQFLRYELNYIEKNIILIACIFLNNFLIFLYFNYSKNKSNVKKAPDFL
jgi:hypothetical protein